MDTDTTDRTPPPLRGAPQQDRALADLQFIRETLDRATAFTALSGLAFMLIGAGALVTGLVAQQLADPLWQVAVWTADAALSVLVSTLFSLRKARRAGQSLAAGAFRKFLTALVPAILAGAVLTAAVMRLQVWVLLPSLWLLLYGCAWVAAGLFSIPVVSRMGGGFLLLGMLSAVAPAAWGPHVMVLGFAGLHLVFGWIIAKRHGG